MKRFVHLIVFRLRALIIGAFLWFAASREAAWAQCSLCRSSLSAKEQESNLVEQINIGILLMLAVPYIALVVIVWSWRRHARSQKELETE